MRRISEADDDLIARLPDEAKRRALRARAGAYAGDCGCTMGAAFLAGALPVALLYVLLTGNHRALRIFGAIGFVFAAAALGKLCGLALASLKLLLLRRSVFRQLRTGKVGAHVHVH